MKRTAATLIIALLITAAAGTLLVRLGKANPILVKPLYAMISIQQPQEKTYNYSTLTLGFTAKTNADPSLLEYAYVLDRDVVGIISEFNVTKTETIYNDQPDWTGDKPTTYYHYYYHPYVEYTLEGNAELPSLSEGWHNITVYQGDINDFLFSDTITFGINTGSDGDVDSAATAPSPISVVLAAMAVLVVSVNTGLFLIAHRKRRREAQQT